MTSPAVDMAEYLVAQGVGVLGAATGWSINAGTEPMKPDTCLTVYDTGGLGFDIDSDIEQPGIQVRARGNDYRATYAKLATVVSELATPTRIGKYVGAWLNGNIESLGKNENDHFVLVVNFYLMRESA